MVSSQKHKIDPSRTGNEICQKVIEDHLKSCNLPDIEKNAEHIMHKIRGNQFPLVVIQQGQLSDMLDAAEANVKENEHLRAEIDNLRRQIDEATQISETPLEG